MSDARRGFWSGIVAYVLWGLTAIYWKQLDHVPALEILSHRVVWGFVACLVFLTLRRQWSWLRPFLQNRRAMLAVSASAFVLSLNWGLYIWAVTSGHIVDGSLGYFINPLLSVFLGVVVLGESLRRLQWVSLGAALAGVLYLTYAFGKPPWIALGLASTFALYGLLKKQTDLPALPALSVESMLASVPALAYLVYVGNSGEGSFAMDAATQWLLIAAGFATAIPLLCFAFAARRIPLTTLGLLQYISPSLQLAFGVLLYNEGFADRAFGFVLIWIGLVLYAGEGLLHRRRRRGLAIA